MADDPVAPSVDLPGEPAQAAPGNELPVATDGAPGVDRPAAVVAPPGDSSAATASLEAPAPAPVPGRVSPYDFRNPVFLSEGELRRLRLLQDEFARYLSARLSLYLRMEFSLKVASLTTTSYLKFTSALASPTHLSLLKIEPLIGVGLLELNPQLALTIADRLLGGRGQGPTEARCLSEIEVALIEDVVNLVLTEWCAQWKSVQELKPVVIGHEDDGRFLQTSALETVMLVLVLDATLGECTGKIQLGIPFATVEAVIKKMDARRLREAPIAVAEKRSTWQGSFNRITVPVQAEWQALELSLRELSSLRIGDVIEMPPAIFKETRVLFNGSPKFIGTVGLDGDRVAVQLNQKTPPEENYHASPTGRKVA